MCDSSGSNSLLLYGVVIFTTFEVIFEAYLSYQGHG